MARKEIDITISEGTPETNRDFGKVFHIREMAASKGEKWAFRVLSMAAKGGVDIGQAQGMGMAGIAMLGFGALLQSNFDAIEPLLDEMMECITFKPNKDNLSIVRPLFEDDIDEIKTRFDLRGEVLKIHMGFFPGVAPLTPTSETVSTAQPSSNIQMSPQASVQFSRSPKTKRPR